MRPTTKRLLTWAALISLVSLFGFVLSYIFQWPGYFTIGGPTDSKVTLADDIVAGTPLSIPLIPWAMLIAFTVLAASRRWWGTIAVVALSLLGALFIFGGWGEAFGPHNPHVPRVVLLAAGILYGLLGLLLLLFGVLELVDRVGAWRVQRRS